MPLRLRGGCKTARTGFNRVMAGVQLPGGGAAANLFLERPVDLFWLVLLGAGFGAGAVSAATGIGWGILIVPLLLLKSDIPPKQVVAIALLSFLFNGAMASFQNVRHGLVVWD